MIRISSPWLYRKNFDLGFILLPAFVSVVVALGFSDYFNKLEALPSWLWFVLVMGIDVSHVYSTLYKTYLHPGEYLQNKNLLLLTPLIVWVVGVIIHTLSAKLFWTTLAYLAVFHFIRQQYGFMRLYGRCEIRSKLQRKLEALVIYAGTLYPIIYWHTYSRDFYWFIEGDFIIGIHPIVERVSFVLYLLIICSYIIRELLGLKRGEPLNLPKNMIIAGTILSWYVGIVLLNGDFTFTVTNIVAHGIPYMALVWIWGLKNESNVLSFKFGFIPFIVLILILAYVEEAIWAGFIWREHLDIFVFFRDVPVINDKKALTLIVPLLILPQATHYVLDGFIWKKNQSLN